MHSIDGTTCTPTPKRLLIAEDDPLNRMLFVMLAESLGHAIDSVENGSLALQLAAEHAYHAILLDIEMPVMGGLEAAARLRNGEFGTYNISVPLVMISAYEPEHLEITYQAAGFNTFITKPVDPAVFKQKIDDILAADGDDAAC